MKAELKNRVDMALAHLRAQVCPFVGKIGDIEFVFNGKLIDTDRRAELSTERKSLIDEKNGLLEKGAELEKAGEKLSDADVARIQEIDDRLVENLAEIFIEEIPSWWPESYNAEEYDPSEEPVPFDLETVRAIFSTNWRMAWDVMSDRVTAQRPKATTSNS